MATRKSWDGNIWEGKVLKEKIYMLVLVVICNLDSALVLKS